MLNRDPANPNNEINTNLSMISFNDQKIANATSQKIGMDVTVIFFAAPAIFFQNGTMETSITTSSIPENVALGD